MVRVGITGVGIVGGTAINVEEFGYSLKTGLSGIKTLEQPENGFTKKPGIGSEICDFDFSRVIKQNTSLPDDLRKRALKCGRRAPKTIQTSILAALEAWKMGGLTNNCVPKDRIGLIVAGNNINQNYSYSLQSRLKEDVEYVSPTYALHFMDTDHVGILSDIFRINGEGFSIGGASASGNTALIKAYQLIKSKGADICLVIGPFADISPIEWQAFVNIGAMGGKRFASKPSQACRPFDKDHEGFIYGQATGCVILEDIACAQHRKADLLAEMAGGAIVLSGNRLADPEVADEVRAMKSAMDAAGVETMDIDYINAHGSSSPLGDQTEINAIKELFKADVANLGINSTKSLTGHCLCSAGLVECIATVIQIKDGFLHPNCNLEKPIDDECNFCGSLSEKADIQTAISNSFGFGGINTSIVLKKME